jgi:hypothetical protein
MIMFALVVSLLVAGQPHCRVQQVVQPHVAAAAAPAYVAPAVPAYVAPAVVDYKADGWREQLLAIAAERDEHRQYLEAVNALGLGGGRGAVDLYGQISTYGHPFAAQGATQYGQVSLQGAYPDVDLKVLFNQASKLAENAQGLAGQATGDFAGLVSQEGLQRAEVARIIARGQAAAQVLAAMQDQQGSVTSTEFLLRQKPSGDWQVGPQTGGALQGQAPQEILGQPSQAPAQIDALVAAKCAKCHTGPNAKSGLQLAAWSALSSETQRNVLSRILSDDAEVRMPPPPADGLTVAEKLVFVTGR